MIRHKHSLQLACCDFILLLLSLAVCFVAASVGTVSNILPYAAGWIICLFFCRILFGVYSHVWRYGNAALYLRLILSDALAGAVCAFFAWFSGLSKITIFPLISAAMVELLLAVMIRMIYQYLLDNAARRTWKVVQGRRLARALFGLDIKPEAEVGKRVNAAIVGAGRLGAALAEELLKNPRAEYQPCCFIEIDEEKIG